MPHTSPTTRRKPRGIAPRPEQPIFPWLNVSSWLGCLMRKLLLSMVLDQIELNFHSAAVSVWSDDWAVQDEAAKINGSGKYSRECEAAYSEKQYQTPMQKICLNVRPSSCKLSNIWWLCAPCWPGNSVDSPEAALLSKIDTNLPQWYNSFFNTFSLLCAWWTILSARIHCRLIHLWSGRSRINWPYRRNRTFCVAREPDEFATKTNTNWYLHWLHPVAARF